MSLVQIDIYIMCANQEFLRHTKYIYISYIGWLGGSAKHINNDDV